MLCQLTRDDAAALGAVAYAASTDAQRPILNTVEVRTFGTVAGLTVTATATDSYMLAQYGVAMPLAADAGSKGSWAAFDPAVETQASLDQSLMVDAKAFVKAVKDAVGNRKNANHPVYVEITGEKLVIEAQSTGSICKAETKLGDYPKYWQIIPSWLTHSRGVPPTHKVLKALADQTEGAKLPALTGEKLTKLMRSQADLGSAGFGDLPLRIAPAKDEADKQDLGSWTFYRPCGENGWYVGLLMPVRI